jgi:hypothetical protein
MVRARFRASSDHGASDHREGHGSHGVHGHPGAYGGHRLWRACGDVRHVKATLESTLASGKLAMLELNHKRNVAERARDAKSAFFSE